MNRNIFTVAQVNGYMKHIFENDLVLNSIFVKGEISNLKKHSSGHFYFTIKDDQAAMNCVMFKTNSQKLLFDPKDGMNVIIFGYVSVYEKTGQYQLYAEMMEASGAGDLYADFLKLKSKLEKEGLFDAKHKKVIPVFPKRVAVVTSPTGAAVRDIINIIKRRNPSIEIVVVPALVQGSEAVQSIKNAIELVNTFKNTDLIIVGRGGGSIEDLWAFNEEVTVRAVFNSKIPIISAVGHETDFTITDFVADLRAETPSAAAEIASYETSIMKNNLNYLEVQLKKIMNSKVSFYKMKLENMKKQLNMKKYTTSIYNNQLHVFKIQKNILSTFQNKVDKNKLILKHSISRLEVVSPMNVLSRGYSVVYNEENKVVSSSHDIKHNENISILLCDGKIKAKVVE